MFRKEIRRGRDIRWNKEVVPPLGDLTQLSLEIVKEKGLRNFLYLKNNCSSKIMQMYFKKGVKKAPELGSFS